LLHRTGTSNVPPEHGRFLAEHIAGARLVELPGSDFGLPWQGADVALDHIEEFLAGLRRPPQPTRVMSTVLFTDIVASTEQASRLGDWRWRELMEVHDQAARRVMEEFDGRLVTTTGDGILATLTAPAERSAARPRSGPSWVGSASRSGRGCTPARSSDETATSAGSPCTLPPG
jgi:class 3 adenylate cyclase